MNLENAFAEITEFLDSKNEWLLNHLSGKTFALQRSEIELILEHNKMIFGFLDEKGFQVWRVADYKIENEKITLDLIRNFEKEREKIRLVPRVSASELSEAIELARLEKANNIASLLIAEKRCAKLVRVALNEKNGRFAQIIFENSNGRQIAALADVSDIITPENFLTTAILWLAQLENRKKKPINEIWILAGKKRAKNLQKLHALLSENWKQKIKLWEISRKPVKTQSVEASILEQLKRFEIKDLWREKPKEISLTEGFEISRAAQEIINLAPEKIDLLFTKHGETLRFSGLPFARVRKLFGEEKTWFGIERGKQILNENSREDFFDLLEDLKIYRHADSPNERHAFFRLAPEAWLEAVLRRNIKLLDANLILSPIYNQFRASNDKIDLLALRRDGRLTIVELKVSPDREMTFQAADYWRKIELQRKKGNLQKARIFGDFEIADAPTLVYLAAPTLSFHYDFEFLSKTVSPEIEIYRFDLNENWRESLKVLKREKI
ncbi:MAG TPA: hypothetical protein VNI60_01115 [Pyrinomonadaceae bacterium]|nr:hypothetical protein [Pyrinomonadaceae bacterium]